MIKKPVAVIDQAVAMIKKPVTVIDQVVAMIEKQLHALATAYLMSATNFLKNASK